MRGMRCPHLSPLNVPPDILARERRKKAKGAAYFDFELDRDVNPPRLRTINVHRGWRAEHGRLGGRVKCEGEPAGIIGNDAGIIGNDVVDGSGGMFIVNDVFNSRGRNGWSWLSGVRYVVELDGQWAQKIRVQEGDRLPPSESIRMEG